MTAITTKVLVAALRKVPEKTFRIFELAPQLLDANGKVSVEKCIDNHADINMAIMELDRYTHDVRELRESLPRRLPEGGQQRHNDEEDFDGIDDFEAEGME
jgi:hypothetical protein